MKKWLGYFLRTIAWVLGLLAAVIIFFGVQASLRESKARHEVAPQTGQFVQAGDVEIFIQQMGPEDGETILFIHGTGAWSGLWRETMIPLAAAGYRCIAIDIPPFGYSEKPSNPSYGNADQAKRIIALMDELKIEHAMLLGHSFGGGATVETALMIPDRIDALILVDIGGLNLNLQDTNGDQKLTALEIFFDTPIVRDPILAATATNPLLTKPLISAMVLDPDDITSEKTEILQQPLSLKGATNTLGEWLQYVLSPQSPSLTSNPSNYETLGMPTLIIWGDSDTIISIKEGEYLNDILPNSELVVMEDVNHIPYIEDNKKFVETVLAFLDR